MEQQNNESNDEINLYDLWEVVGKRKKLIIGVFLMIVISTALISLFMPKIYRGEVNLCIVDNIAAGDKHAEGANEIIALLGSIDGEKKELIFHKTYTSVKSVKLKALKDVTYKIAATIEAKNTDDISVAAAELVDFLNNIDSVKANTNEEREILTKRSLEMSSLLESAPNLIVSYNKILAEGKLLPMGFNPIDLSKRIADIKIEKLMVEQALSRLKNGRIQMTTRPYIFKKPVSPKITNNVMLASLIGLLMGIMLAFFIEHIEKIKKTRSVNSNS